MSMRNKWGGRALIELCKAYLKLDDIDKCIITLLKAIQLPKLKSKELKSIDGCVGLLATTNIEEAIKNLEFCFSPELFDLDRQEHLLKFYSWERVLKEYRKSKNDACL